VQQTDQGYSITSLARASSQDINAERLERDRAFRAITAKAKMISG
jgi:hypothetical protein